MCYWFIKVGIVLLVLCMVRRFKYVKLKGNYEVYVNKVFLVIVL